MAAVRHSLMMRPQQAGLQFHCPQPIPQLALCPQLRRPASRRGRAPCAAVAGQPASAVQFSVRQASSAAELRAAGYLRAHTFYSYPPDRSEYSTRMHRRMKGDAEWQSVTSKVAGTEQEYKALQVVCLIATMDIGSPQCPVAAEAASQLDPSSKLPAGASGQPPPQVVVGSLDVNQGAVLPAEDLVGRLPASDAAVRRAYLSNVCVAAAARRQGIAAALIEAASDLARSRGVEHMYVHVVADNAPAAQLYRRLGFEREAQESEAFARALRRPRRLLLHKQLG